MKYHLDYKNNKLLFSETLPKVKDGIKVYYYREVDERTRNDYPVAIADTNGETELDWNLSPRILTVEIKKPRLWGLFGYKWEVVTGSYPQF